MKIRLSLNATIAKKLAEGGSGLSNPILMSIITTRFRGWLFKREYGSLVVDTTVDSLAMKWWWYLTDPSYRKLYKFIQSFRNLASPPCYVIAEFSLGMCARSGGVDFFRLDPNDSYAIQNVRDAYLGGARNRDNNDCLHLIYGGFRGFGVSWREISPALKGQRLKFLLDHRPMVRELGKHL